MLAIVSDDAGTQKNTLKLESVALDDARWAGMLPWRDPDPLTAAGHAGPLNR